MPSGGSRQAFPLLSSSSSSPPLPPAPDPTVSVAHHSFLLHSASVPVHGFILFAVCVAVLGFPCTVIYFFFTLPAFYTYGFSLYIVFFFYCIFYISSLVAVRLILTFASAVGKVAASTSTPLPLPLTASSPSYLSSHFTAFSSCHLFFFPWHFSAFIFVLVYDFFASVT